MSCIKQYQRRAIEALARQKVFRPMEIKSGAKFFLEGREVFFCGISQGEGTCSDMHDVDFAVFSRLEAETKPLPKTLRLVSGAVLVREAKTRAERNAIGNYHGQLVCVVEALRHDDIRLDLVSFRKIGKKKSYVSIAG